MFSFPRSLFNIQLVFYHFEQLQLLKNIDSQILMTERKVTSMLLLENGVNEVWHVFWGIRCYMNVVNKHPHLLKPTQIFTLRNPHPPAIHHSWETPPTFTPRFPPKIHICGFAAKRVGYHCITSRCVSHSTSWSTLYRAIIFSSFYTDVRDEWYVTKLKIMTAAFSGECLRPADRHQCRHCIILTLTLLTVERSS